MANKLGKKINVINAITKVNGQKNSDGFNSIAK
ncbi:hypothetical protein HDF22_000516 [Mucilaginibacter lappiensis]|uniref:Uncharacterized protein n=1 Tax=Mucilaginibacter lappiensis TaxID=354630 RepID=A0A841JD67_9SPHI|nr:hypothetical protein [Mucilaginibacter lappiensis]MBB6126415.1 hypothetical protein [Mucilaginibacter lappiensis]